MSYTGTTISDGPWLQGLTSSATALQGVWSTDLISYNASNNFTATLAFSLKANWRINPTLQGGGAVLNSWHPSSASTIDEYGQFHTYPTSGIPLGPEDLIRVGENHAGLIKDPTAYPSGSTVTFGSFSRWTTLVEVLP